MNLSLLLLATFKGVFTDPNSSGSPSIISTNDNNNVAIEILAHNSQNSKTINTHDWTNDKAFV